MLVERRGRPALRWALSGAGYLLLLVAWAFASPFGAAPDEGAHAVRAAAAGTGQWTGQPATPYTADAHRSQAQAGALNQQAQRFAIPAGMVPPAPCFAGRLDQAAWCVDVQAAPQQSGAVQATTYETTAPPGLYALAGAAMQLPGTGLPPGYLGRLAVAVVCGLLLAGAAWAAGARGSLWPQAGVALAATPTVLFLGAALSTAGVAAAAAICFATGVLAFSMGPPRRGLAPLIGASGVVLALVSAAGALAIVVLIGALLPLAQLRRLTGLGPVLASAAVTAAVVAGVDLALDHRTLPPGPADLASAVPAVVTAAPGLLQQAIGAFGWWDLALPAAGVLVWGGLAVVGVSTALLVGRWRDRLVLLLLAGGALAAAVVAQAFVLAPVGGWDLRGSFLLPILAPMPVVAGFVLYAARLHPRVDATLVGLAVVAVQLLAFWESARRYAVGVQGPTNFLDSAQWAPPAGWLPWLVLAGAGGLLLLIALAPLTGRERDEEAWGPLVVIDPISVGR
jgi:Predicted membrane protein (DUF2142)